MQRFYIPAEMDGRSMFGGSAGLRLEPGAAVSVPPSERGKSVAGTGHILAADLEPEALFAGRWPVRLFLASSDEGNLGASGGGEHVFAFWEMQVIAEVQAWRALCPNGLEAAEFVEAASKLSPAQAEALEAEFEIRKDGLGEIQRHAGGLLRAANRSRAHLSAAMAARPPGEYRLQYPTFHVAMALIGRDLLTPEMFNVLTRPWTESIGRTWAAEQSLGAKLIGGTWSSPVAGWTASMELM